MRLRDYFGGKSVRLHSLLSPHTVSERINAAAGSRFWPFTTGVVGGVWAGHVRLRFRSSITEYNAKPVLADRLREGSTGSTLILRYRAPAWAYVFDLFWYSVLGLVTFGLLVGGIRPDTTSGDLVTAVAVCLTLLIFPLVMHYVGTRNSDQELRQLLHFLAEHVDAKLEPSQSPHPRHA